MKAEIREKRSGLLKKRCCFSNIRYLLIQALLLCKNSKVKLWLFRISKCCEAQRLPGCQNILTDKQCNRGCIHIVILVTSTEVTYGIAERGRKKSIRTCWASGGLSETIVRFVCCCFFRRHSENISTDLLPLQTLRLSINLGISWGSITLVSGIWIAAFARLFTSERITTKDLYNRWESFTKSSSRQRNFDVSAYLNSVSYA